MGERGDHLQWERNLSAFLPAEVTGINDSLSRDRFGRVSPLGTDSGVLAQEHFHTQQWIFPETSTFGNNIPLQFSVFLYSSCYFSIDLSVASQSIFQLLSPLMSFWRFFFAFP